MSKFGFVCMLSKDIPACPDDNNNNKALAGESVDKRGVSASRNSQCAWWRRMGETLCRQYIMRIGKSLLRLARRSNEREWCRETRKFISGEMSPEGVEAK